MPTRGQGGRRVLKKRRRSRLRALGVSLYIFIVIISALVVGTYAVWQINVKPPEIDRSSEATSSKALSAVQVVSSDPDEAAGQGGAQDSGQTLDEPAGRARREGVYTFVLLGKDYDSGNTDSIILVTFDTVERKVGMTSIPRDSIVRRSWSSNLKINAAYGMKGPDTLKEELESTFGIPVDFYVCVSLKGFIALVNELGGVDVYIPVNMSYDDPYQNLSIHYSKGQKHLNGQQAMEVARFRHNNDGSGYNDEGRAQMQRTILMALAKKVLSWNSLTRVQSFVDIFQKYVKTDMSAEDMLYFASQAIYVDPSEGLQQGVLEGRSDAIYKGNYWCYVYEAPDILPTLNMLLNPYDRDLTADDLDLLKADRYYFNS